MAVRFYEKPFLTAAVFCVFVFYFVIGKDKVPQRNSFHSLIPNENIQNIHGVLISSPVKSQRGTVYSAKMEVRKAGADGLLSNACGNITVLIPTEMAECFFPGKLYSKASGHGSFMYEAGGEYDFCGYFVKNNKKALPVFFVKSCSSCTWEDNLFGHIDHFRALSRLQFKRLMFAWKDSGGLLLALLSGSREYLEDSLYSDFRKSGLSHIIALSGMHLSMFSSIALFFGMRFGRKRLAFFIRLFALIIFVWFAGFSPSLLRAFICAMLVLFAGVCGVQNPDMLMILCFSFLLQVVISPSDLLNPGFLLSYAAITGILFLSRLFNQIYSRIFPSYFASSLSASSGAQLFTFPVSLKLFGFVSPVGIVAAVFVAPLISVFIYSGLILIIMCLIFPGLCEYSAFFVAIEYNLIKFVVGIFSCAPVWSLS